MNEIANYINQYTSNHHQHSDSITRYDGHSVNLSLSLCLTVYCRMTHLQYYLFVALILALHALHALKYGDSVQDIYTQQHLSLLQICRSFS